MARACKFSVATIIYSSHSSFFALCISIRSLFFTNTLQTAEQEQKLQQSSDAATDGCIGWSAAFWCEARKQTVSRVNGTEDGKAWAGELEKCFSFHWESFSRGCLHEREREECQDYYCQGKLRSSSSGNAKQIVERLYISKKSCWCVMNLMARGRNVCNILNFAFESLFSFCSVSNQF